MKQIRVIFETDNHKMGYLLDPSTLRCQAGMFSQDYAEIVEKTQDGIIDNPEELCKQIYFVLLAGLKDK